MPLLNLTERAHSFPAQINAKQAEILHEGIARCAAHPELSLLESALPVGWRLTTRPGTDQKFSLAWVLAKHKGSDEAVALA